MRSKKLVIGLLMLLALVFTTGTFAYWAGYAGVGVTTSSTSVTIGSADDTPSTVTVTAQSNSVGNLVPVNQVGSGQTSSVELTFPVSWAVDGTEYAGISGDLAVTFGNYEIGTLIGADVTDMFTITWDSTPATLTEGAAAVDVVVTIEFTTEPADKATYDKVAGGRLTFDVTFTVTPEPEV